MEQVQVRMKMAVAIKEVLDEFLSQPLGWVTEHALHAAFIQKLNQKFQDAPIVNSGIPGYSVNRVQNEYPTLTDLGRTKRQHWDVAILSAPPRGPNPS
jgi:hypothetical protein